MSRITNASLYIDWAHTNGMDDQEIAKLCGVSESTVIQWSIKNIASDKIKPLIHKLGRIYSSVNDVAELLVEWYEKTGRCYRIKRNILTQIVGVKFSRVFYQLEGYLENLGYTLIESIDGEDDILIVIKTSELIAFTTKITPNMDGIVKVTSLRLYNREDD